MNDDKEKLQQIAPDQNDLPSIDDLQKAKKRRKLSVKSVVIICLVILLFGAGVIFFMNPDSSIKRSADILPSQVTSLFTNKLKVYKTAASAEIGATRQVQYTLTDETGAILYQGSQDDRLELVTTVGEDSLLFYEENAAQYWLLSKNGFTKLSNLPDSMAVRDYVGQNSPAVVTGFDERSVIYQYCGDIDENTFGLECDIRIVNLENGQEEKIEIPELQQYNARLQTISGDNKYAYFLGVPKNALENIQENELFQRVVQVVDIAAKKVIATYPIETQLTYYDKFWISPNGRHLVYSNFGEQGELQYISVADGKQGTIPLPKPDYASEPWGGRTTTYDPSFSPDGNYMIFASYTSDSNMSEVAGIIDLNNKSSKTIYSDTSTKEKNDDEISDFRWTSKATVDFVVGAKNQNYNLTTNALQEIDNKYGTLVGIGDDRL